jgi:hypothetical protein
VVDLEPNVHLEPGAWRQLVQSRDTGGPGDYLVTYVGAPVVDEPRGAIELSQPLAPRADYAWQGALGAMASSLAMVRRRRHDGGDRRARRRPPGSGADDGGAPHRRR